MKNKKIKIPNRFFKEPRLEILRTLIQELTNWESSKSVTTNELLTLVDKLKVIIRGGLNE